MTKLRLREEMQRHQWAMTPASLNAILSVLDGVELTEHDYKFFHTVSVEHRQVFSETSLFGAPVADTFYSSIKDNVGFLNINGPIIPRATWFSNASGMVAIDALTAEFKALEQNPRVESIVLLLDSPGGAVTGVSDFASVLKASGKRTYAFAWTAASAAYWIASAADTIVSPDTGLVGSIGTVISLTDYSEADRKKGVKQIEIVSAQSPNKRPDINTVEGQAVLQQLVDELSDVFIDTVGANRNKTSAEVMATFGAGALLVAKRALTVGMVDVIQDVNSFVDGLTTEQFTTLRGFQYSNSENPVNTTTEVKNMDPKENPTAADLKGLYPVAVAQLQSAACAEERARIQAIEAINSIFDASLPAVRKAAREAIDTKKYEAGATVESVQASMLVHTAQAQAGAVADYAEAKRDSAELVSSVSTPTVTPDTKTSDAQASEARVNALIAANKEAGGKS